MSYEEFVTFLEGFMHDRVKKLYYCEPYKNLVDGIRHIENDFDLGDFAFDAYDTDYKICVCGPRRGGNRELVSPRWRQ